MLQRCVAVLCLSPYLDRSTLPATDVAQETLLSRGMIYLL